MTSFHYPLPPPESEPTSSLGGLSDEAKAALTGIAMGPSPADKLLGSDGSIIDTLSREAIGWLYSELLINGTLDSWQLYKDKLVVPVPTSVDDLIASNPNLAQTVNRLYEAKQALRSSGETTPGEQNVGETMHLVLVPWQEIRIHLSDFDQWIKTMRDVQGIATSDDHINEYILNAIKSNQPLYRDYEQPTQLLTPTEYLDRKITEDGPVGIMLMQTSKEAGLKRIVEGPAENRSPKAMTNDGADHFEVAGQSVDAMGVFEWIALTMQRDPRELSTEDISWLLANRMTIYGDPCVPSGKRNGDQIRTRLDLAIWHDSNFRVRLAVTG